MRHLDLFSGIGGFALATEMVWQNVEHEFVEIDSFCQAVLKKHWPKSHIHGDIKTYRGGSSTVDLLTGGFPCQPFSNAGKRKGTEDDRHLWPEMLRVIREVRPRWVLGENVDGIFTWNDGLVFEQVLASVEGAGYEVQPYRIPASAVGAHHKRDRYWFMAHTDGSGHVHGQPQKLAAKARLDAFRESLAGGADVADSHEIGRRRRCDEGLEAKTKERREGGTGPAQCGKNVSDAQGVGWREGDTNTGRCGAGAATQKEWGRLADRSRWPAEPDVGRVAHGVPNRVDRIKALGNAIVPQVAAQIMRAIQYADK